jgi:hypothetical protein
MRFFNKNFYCITDCNFYCITDCNLQYKNLNHKKRRLNGIKKIFIAPKWPPDRIQWVRPMGNTRAFCKSVVHWSHCCPLVTVAHWSHPLYSRNKVGKSSTVFFKNYLNQFLEKWSGFLKVFKNFFHYTKLQKRSLDLQIRK